MAKSRAASPRSCIESRQLAKYEYLMLWSAYKTICVNALQIQIHIYHIYTYVCKLLINVKPLFVKERQKLMIILLASVTRDPHNDPENPPAATVAAKKIQKMQQIRGKKKKVCHWPIELYCQLTLAAVLFVVWPQTKSQLRRRSSSSDVCWLTHASRPLCCTRRPHATESVVVVASSLSDLCALS